MHIYIEKKENAYSYNRLYNFLINADLKEVYHL